MTNFDGIPDELLEQILSRLVCNIELVFQCKCVCKRWLHVITSPHFICRCVRLQRDFLQMQIPTCLVMFSDFWSCKDLTLSSKHPFLTSRSRNFSLDFLPCYQGIEKLQELAKSSGWRIPREQGQLVPPVVMGTYKDLILCCATNYDQRNYFLCNPITKHWVALPPTPRLYEKVAVAFVCDPYYYDGSEQEQQQHISAVTLSVRPVVDAEYMWKVVRLVPSSKNRKFNIEIFSSKTREWTELVVLRSPPVNKMFDSRSLVAYKGMLYWCGVGFIFELDLDDHSYNSNNMKNNKNIAKCRFIKVPECTELGGRLYRFPYLVVTGGRLRLYMYRPYDNQESALRIWELKQVVKDDGGGKFKFKWLVDSVSLTLQVETMYLYGEGEWFYVGGFHQNNEDIMYFQYNQYLVTCNIRGGRLEMVSKIKYDGCTLENYLFVFPWWPTPVLHL